jgi:ATP-dependent DNA ligase
MDARTLRELKARLEPLAVKRMPLAVPPPRATRFGSPLELSRVHWVKPKLVAEVTFMTWTDDGSCGTSCSKACATTSRRRMFASSEKGRSRPGKMPSDCRRVLTSCLLDLGCDAGRWV